MLIPATILLTLATLSSAQQETILGAYIFHRHGDRTPKSLPPANLTDLGYAQVFSAGSYYRSRYVSSSASSPISGLNSDVVRQSQIEVSAPADDVLMNSAQGFLQALYPPVGAALGTQRLRNGSRVEAPMDGFQLIPVGTVEGGAGSENTGWLQDATDCGAAEQSSNDYYYTPEYNDLYSSTQDFYKSLLPVVTPTFNESYMSYKNAYTIFDLINVATIHNASIPSSNLLTPSTFSRLGSLANTHEYNLAYNASSPIRAISGMQLAAEALQFLEMTISSSGANKLGIQFGAYASFQSYFGLADLPAADASLTGIPDYASSMVWELFTSAPVSGGQFPGQEDLQVRFFFHNGTTNSSSEPVQYPLFGGSDMSVSWMDFMSETQKFAVGTTEAWCMACGNSTGQCAQYASTSGSSGSSSGSGGSGSGSGGISKAVAGVIGAMVTLGVILLIEGAIMLFGGLTIVRRKRLAAGKAVAAGTNGSKA